MDVADKELILLPSTFNKSTTVGLATELFTKYNSPISEEETEILLLGVIVPVVINVATGSELSITTFLGYKLEILTPSDT